MWDYFKTVNDILEAIIWGVVAVIAIALTAALIYFIIKLGMRLYKFGFKLKVGDKELDSSDDAPEVKNDTK